MSVISQVERTKQTQKPLGVYLVEAGLITPAQVDMALNEQKVNRRRLGEILALRGWIEPQTIEYLMEKLVLPERWALKEESRVSRGSTKAEGEKDRPQGAGHEPSVLKKRCRPSRGSASTEDPLAPPAPEALFVNLSPRRTIRLLLLVVLFLTLAGIVAQFNLYFLPDYPSRDTFIKLFNVNIESNIPAWYSSLTLLFCSSLLTIITFAKKKEGDRYALYWGALSVIFLFLSLDEAVSIHEIGNKLQPVINARGFILFSWVIPGTIFMLICLLLFLRFLAALPAKTRRLFLIAGTLFVGGTIGMEMVGAYYTDLYGEQNMTYAIIVTIEEFLEMLGIVVFIYALLSYMSSYMKGVSLRVNNMDYRRQHRSA